MMRSSVKPRGRFGISAKRAARWAVVSLSLGVAPAGLAQFEELTPAPGEKKPAAEEAPAAEQAPTAERKPGPEPVPDAGNTVVINGDTMWDLSGRYLGNPYEWPRLWSYNPEVTNPHWIYPGYVMRLREGASGGTGAAPAAPGAAFDEAAFGESLVSGKSRFGTGFGVRNLFRKDGAIMIGEQAFLDKEAIESAGRIIGSREDHMMVSPTDEVYVKFSGDNAPAEGDELTVFKHVLKRENSPKAGPWFNVAQGQDKDGEIVRVLGSLRVKSFDSENKVARAVVLEATDPIERGFEVADMPRKLAQVPPRANTKEIESKILAATRPLGTLGHSQLVFIGVGKSQGVQTGNRFVVVRRGDPWRSNLTVRETRTSAERPVQKKPSNKQFPLETVAEIRVLYVRPDTCTGIIIKSEVEVEIGDEVRMYEGY